MAGAYPRPKLLLVGLDGATWDVIRPALSEGRLPVLARIIGSGVWGNLRSTVPPYTTPAWASLAAGCSPGGHGIYSWEVLRPGSYQTSLATRSHVQAITLFEALDCQGCPVGAYAIPMTYPPAHLQSGYMVCCFDAPRPDESMAYPSEIVRELQEAVGDPALQLQMPRLSNGVFDFDAARSLADTATRASLHLLSRRPTELFALDYMVTDILGHYFYGERTQRGTDGDEVEDAVLWAYCAADAALGELLDALGEDVTVVVMSDHGMGVGVWEVDLNHILSATGFLKRRVGHDGVAARIRELGLHALRRGRRALVPDAVWANLCRRGVVDGARAFAAAAEVDWGRTQAFSWSLGGVIRLNLKGRDPQGTVEPADAAALKRDVTAALRGHALPELGDSAVRDVLDSADVYPESPMAGVAPDLLALPNRELGCEFCPPSLGHAGEAVQALAGGSPPRSGVHRRVGILAASGPLVPASGRLPDLSISDIAPTLVHLLGHRIPQSMTGQVVEGLLGEEAALRREPQYAAFEAPGRHGTAAEPSQADEELVKARLRDLGYFE